MGSERLVVAAVMILLCWTFRSAADFMAKLSEQWLLREVSLRTMTDLVRHMLSMSVAFMERNSRGDLVQAARGDVSSVQNAISLCCQSTQNVVMMISLVIASFIISPYLAFIGLVLLPIAGFPIIYLGKRMLTASKHMRWTSTILMDRIMQICIGFRVIKVYQGEPQELEQFNHTAAEYYDHTLRRTQMQALAGVALEGLAGLGVVLVVLAGGFRVLKGEMQWPALMTFLMALMQTHDPARVLAHCWANIQYNIPGADRLNELMAIKTGVVDRTDALPLRNPPRRIRFENVSFAYETDVVLRDLNLEIRAGEVIGLVGPSGSGKSSLMSLAVRFYDPTVGRITFDGVDLRDFRLDDVMAQVAIVLQDPFLFSASVRENIRYGRPGATPEEVEAAARDANIHEEVMALPDGYDTPIGPGGYGLSGGQRQRINIARALLKDVPILLLDEATSALDSVSEMKVQEALERLMVGRTTLIAAHRLSTLRHADRIVVLSHGEVEAVGPHQELLRTSPTYRVLCERQSLAGELSSLDTASEEEVVAIAS
jgi:ABC-type multidrug transport system fused ATPase/permease subunit